MNHTTDPWTRLAGRAAPAFRDPPMLPAGVVERVVDEARRSSSGATIASVESIWMWCGLAAASLAIGLAALQATSTPPATDDDAIAWEDLP